MTPQKRQQMIHQILENLSAQVPTYKSSQADWEICEGNVAVCIIDHEGNIYGKIWGDDKLKGRRYYDVAYRKASQVWITGYKTGEFERLIFTDKLNYRDFGIPLPELMGWEGGQTIQLDDETIISCGFSGFKGATDLAIVKKAAEAALQQV
ncbi:MULTISPECIES: heme-binding protein [Emticicia]|uniref:GlcG/HbpS family heme-binding protein n=1 Tax=Emticicia TaxID=312278 RepID=UPI0007D8BA41|nr:MULTISPECIES: heme-binding protein [Emticicia]